MASRIAKNLYRDIALFFQDSANGPFDIFETLDAEHGRIATRRYFTTDELGWLPGKEEWMSINTICMAVRERQVNAETSIESSYFISSLENHAPTVAKSVREHWGHRKRPALVPGYNLPGRSLPGA